MNEVSTVPTALHQLYVWYPDREAFVGKVEEMLRNGTMKVSKPIDRTDIEILWAIESLYARRAE